jgi:hypothetical protein
MLATVIGIAQIPPAPAGNASTSPSAALLARYCVACHNQKLKTAGLAIDPAGAAHPDGTAEIWEKVVRKLPRAIVREAASQNNTFASLVLGVVKSVPFQMREAQGAADAKSPRGTTGAAN